MVALDIRTVIISYIFIEAVCVTVMAFLWIQNRGHFAGTGFWLAAFVMQFAGVSLIALRTLVPDFISMTVSATLIAAGAILLYTGLEYFAGKRSGQGYNIALLVIFFFLDSYFVVIHPSLNARSILFSLFLLIICSQCAWLMRRRVEAELLPITRIPGMLFIALCAISVARISMGLSFPADNDPFRSPIYDAPFVLASEMLIIVLTFTIFQMVNRRLISDLENHVLAHERVEAALRRSQKQEESFYEFAPDALITVTGDGKISRLNLQAQILFGYDGLELLKEPIEKLIPAAQHTSHRQHWKDYFQSPGSRVMGAGLEVYAVRKDGIKFPVEIGLSPLQVNDEMFVIADVRDISERKRMEETLRESRENFQSYFNMGTVGMCVISPAMKWIETNGRLRQMLGYASEELDDLTWKDISHPDDLKEDLVLFNQVLANQRDSYRIEKRFIRKDGATIYTTMFVACYRNPDGTVRYLLSSLIDITEQKQAEAGLVRLAAIEERQRLARDLHDSVNQSIHSLELFSETLMVTLERNNIDRARQIAGRLQESARQALKETRLLLYESQAPASEKNIALIPELETRLATVERRAGVRTQIIQEGPIEHLPPAWSENLFWITIEALNNAIKHAQAHNMKIILRTSPLHIELEISDDGIGFDSQRTRTGGMGLQNMRERANLLHGSLEILSTRDRGTCVRFKADVEE
jgi:PAS domain S-box-containing protein